MTLPIFTLVLSFYDSGKQHRFFFSSFLVPVLEYETVLFFFLFKVVVLTQCFLLLSL